MSNSKKTLAKNTTSDKTDKVVVKGKPNTAQTQTVSTPSSPSPSPSPAQTQPAQTQPQVAAEKKEKSDRNKSTTKANLTLNVNTFRSWLRNYYLQNGMVRKVEQNDQDKSEKSEPTAPIFRGFHVALTSVCEVLCIEILTATLKQLQKSQSGLYEITRPAIRYAILLDGDLEHLFGQALEMFDKTMSFSSQFCIPQKEMMKFIETNCGKNINLDCAAYNLLSYLLAKVVVDFARTAFFCMNYAGKGSLDFGVVKCLLKMKCVGSLENLLTRNVEDTEKLFVPEKEDSTEAETETAENTNTGDAVNTSTNTTNESQVKAVKDKKVKTPAPKKQELQPVDVDTTEDQVEDTVQDTTEDQEQEQEQEQEPAPVVQETPKPAPKKLVIKKSK